MFDQLLLHKTKSYCNKFLFCGLLGASLLISACSSSHEESQLAAQAIASTNPNFNCKTANPNNPFAPNRAKEASGQDIPYDVSTIKQAKALALAQNLMWLEPFTPYTGSNARVYGSPSNGCLSGAEELSDKDEKFQLQRWTYDRNFAHPIMLQYFHDLKARAAAIDLPPLIVGDLSRAYGGPLGANSSHASHNTGLDMDLPFDFAAPRKTKQELEHPQDNIIVSGKQVLPTFTPAVASYIKLAASDPRVDRVFVAPMIKKHMCSLYANKPESGFLHKLRPWYGHRAHMHVRLNCPSDSPQCVWPAPIPEGDGCGAELDSWFVPPAKTATAIAKAKPKKKVLPEQCTLAMNKYIKNNKNSKQDAPSKAKASKDKSSKAKSSKTAQASAKAKSTKPVAASKQALTSANNKAKASKQAQASSKAKTKAKASTKSSKTAKNTKPAASSKQAQAKAKNSKNQRRS